MKQYSYVATNLILQHVVFFFVVNKLKYNLQIDLELTSRTGHASTQVPQGGLEIWRHNSRPCFVSWNLKTWPKHMHLDIWKIVIWHILNVVNKFLLWTEACLLPNLKVSPHSFHDGHLEDNYTIYARFSKSNTSYYT